MVKLTIDNCEVVVPEHTTILDAAKSVGIQIPTLCYLRDLNEIGGCRVCVVEVEGCDQLVAACNNYVLDGMVVHTNSPKAREARRTNVQLLLSQHDSRCTSCVRSGNCNLQTIANDLGIFYLPYQSSTWRARAGTSISPSSAITTSALNACAASRCARACRA
ncbi:MAG: 2Fe-2S iron-sulfur cluster-binding protein [Collinsella sp.]